MFGGLGWGADMEKHGGSLTTDYWLGSLTINEDTIKNCDSWVLQGHLTTSLCWVETLTLQECPFSTNDMRASRAISSGQGLIIWTNVVRHWPCKMSGFWPIWGLEIISDTHTHKQTENQHTARPCSTSSACKNRQHLQLYFTVQKIENQFGTEA